MVNTMYSLSQKKMESYMEKFSEESMETMYHGVGYVEGMALAEAIKAALAEEFLNMLKAGSRAVDAARNSQGSGRYPGVDDWKPKTYQKGDILYRGEPNGTEFFTTMEAIDSVGANQRALFEGLQVEPHPTLGYRSQMQGYMFMEVVEGAESTCLANPDYGAGGLLQEFVPNANKLIKEGILKLVDTVILH